MSVRILTGDCRDVLRTLEPQSVHTCVTSPPYFGLRDYGHAGQIGLEDTPDAFVAQMVDVFREVRRVLRDDGTLWLNLGDSYANDGKWGGSTGGKHVSALHGDSGVGRQKRATGLKPKDLIGIPWRVAFALQADGWYLRQDIIWSKPNPMPESVTDRCTKAHEYLFLLTKSGDTTIWRARDTKEWSDSPNLAERVSAPTDENPDATAARWRGFDYYFDADAIAEPAVSDHGPGNRTHKAADAYAAGATEHRTKAGLVAYSDRQRSKKNSFARDSKDAGGVSGAKPQHRPDRENISHEGTRNKRSVWTVATEPFKEAHFATYPQRLIEPCILAGSPPGGGVVLDPFGGAGTTGLVADRLGRDAVLIELNPEYAALADRRLRAGMAQVDGESTPDTSDLPLFSGQGDMFAGRAA